MRSMQHSRPVCGHGGDVRLLSLSCTDHISLAVPSLGLVQGSKVRVMLVSGYRSWEAAGPRRDSCVCVQQHVYVQPSTACSMPSCRQHSM